MSLYGRAIRALGSTSPFAWLGARTLHRLDLLFAGSRHTPTTVASGLPVCFLTVRGRRTGRSRTVPLLYVQDGARLVLVATNWGRQRHPAWALNLGLPTRVEATGRKTYQGDNTVPDVMQVDYRFPAAMGRAEVHLTWYHGVPGPALDGSVRHEGFGSGVLFEGDRGKLLADYGKYRVFPEAFARDFVAPPRSIAASRRDVWVRRLRTRFWSTVTAISTSWATVTGACWSSSAR